MSVGGALFAWAHGRIRAVPVLTVVLIATASCDTPRNPYAEVGDEELTIPSQWLYEDMPRIYADSVPVGLTAPDLATWRAARRALLTARPGIVIGSNDPAPSPAVLGSVGDVGMDADGNLYVLDPINHEVRVFDRRGEFLTSAGGSGEGPDELADPIAMVVRGRTTTIADRGGQLKVFELVDSQLQRTAIHRVPSAIRDICHAGDGLVVHGWRSAVGDFLLHELYPDQDGGIRSFGAGIPHDFPLVQGQVNRGLVTCHGDHGTDGRMVVFGYRWLPMLRGYSSTGDVSWTSRLDDYLQRPVIYNEMQGGIYFGSEWAMPWDGLGQVSAFGHSFAVVQYRRYSASSHAVRTHLVDTRTGQGALVSTDLPDLVVLDSTSYATLIAEPFPQVQVWHIGGHGVGGTQR